MTRDETIALFLESQKADKPHLVWNNWALKLLQEKERSMQNKTWSEIETNWQKQAEADFSNIDFAELCPEANSLVFTKFVFPDLANFSFCKFSKAACFDNISAFGPFGIRDSAFAGNAFFLSAKFHENAIFDGVSYSGGAWFKFAAFETDTWFTAADFKRHADFSETSFKGHADFNHATFRSRATFDNAAFGATANFRSSTFEDDVEFSSTSQTVVSFRTIQIFS